MVVRGIAALTVHVTDLDKARKFYAGVLGLKEVGAFDAIHGVVFQIPDGPTLTAHVMEPGDPGRPPGTVSGIVFLVDDVVKAASEVKRRGGAVTDEPQKMPWGAMSATVADPDGNEYLLNQR